MLLRRLVASLLVIFGTGVFFWALSASAQSSLAPEEIQNVFQKIQNLYAPIAKVAAGEFLLQVSWERTTQGASANRDEMNKYVIGVDGGLLVSNRTNSDSLKMALCHEAGHLFGGQPLRPAPAEWEGPLDESGLSLLSAEGQADYYATSVCFRHMVAGEDHRESLKGRAIPQRIIKACDSVWGDRTSDSFLCQRTALAGLDFLNLVMEFPISLNKTDDSVVSKTLNGEYPARQCRLDTLVAGALCNVDAPLDFVRKDKSSEGCRKGIAARPACWYKN